MDSDSSSFSSPDDKVVVGCSQQFAGGEKGGRGKNVKQITWVLLLKAFAPPAASPISPSPPFGVSSGSTDSDESSSLRFRLYACIKIFLFVLIVLLAFEMAAYYYGWHFMAPKLGFRSLISSFYSCWLRFRADFISPLLQFLANICVISFLIQSAHHFLLCVGCLWIRFKRTKPIVNSMTNDVEAVELFSITICVGRTKFRKELIYK